MEKYTPGRWKVSSYDIITEDNRIIVARPVIFNDRAQTNANAARIVACVNALEGIPTEALEAGVIKEMVKMLRGSRLMLYAWQGSRPKEWGEHKELNQTIADIEAILAKIGGN